jgi:hypothetical protein
VSSSSSGETATPLLQLITRAIRQRPSHSLFRDLRLRRGPAWWDLDRLSITTCVRIALTWRWWVGGCVRRTGSNELFPLRAWVTPFQRFPTRRTMTSGRWRWVVTWAAPRTLKLTCYVRQGVLAGDSALPRPYLATLAPGIRYINVCVSVVECVPDAGRRLLSACV